MPNSYYRETLTDGWEQWSNPDTGTVNPKQIYPNQVSASEERTFIGSRTANYRSFRKANGYLPTLYASDSIIRRKTVGVVQTSYGYSYIEGRGNVCVSRWDRYHPGCHSVSAPHGYWNGIDPIFERLLDECWSKTRRKVLDQDFNAPIFLAEGSKTVNMIADRARRLAQAYSSFRKGRLNDVARHLGFHKSNSHNTWLEYKYGWMPLLSDIHGGAKTLAELDFKRDQVTSRSTAVGKWVAPWDHQPGTWTLTAKTWVTTRVRNPSVATVNRIGGLNPVLVAWELIPFSFVADWFVNIGDCIAEATAFSGVTILTGGSSQTMEWAGTIRDTNYSGFDRPFMTTAHVRKYVRNPGVQTMPRLRVKSNPLSLEKLVTAGALLRQSVRRAPTPSQDKVPERNYRDIFPEGYSHL